MAHTGDTTLHENQLAAEIKDKLYLEEFHGSAAASLEEEMAPANQPPVREKYLVYLKMDWKPYHRSGPDKLFEVGKKMAIQVMEEVCGSCRKEDIRSHRVAYFLCALSEDELEKMRRNAGVSAVVPDRGVIPEGLWRYADYDSDESMSDDS